MKLIDGYPQYMLDSIKKVEEKRQVNLDKSIEPMTLEARQDVLNKFHPDFMDTSKREVAIGPNKGELFYNGIADLLESPSILDTSEVDLSKIDYDVDILIIGGGGAGTMAALVALENGVPLDIVSIHARDAVSRLDEILGVGSIADEVLERVFRDFCVGK